MSIETDADGATHGATVQNSRDSVRKQCELHGVVAAAQRSDKGHLSATEGVSASRVSLA